MHNQRLNTTDATAGQTDVADKPAPSKEPEHSSWASGFASTVWGTAKVTECWAAGVAKEAFEHPLKTAAEVAGGIAATAVAAELGIGVVAGAAIGVAALDIYGVVRGVQIAATEGVGAIPEHMRQSFDDAKINFSSLVDAASTVYQSEGGQKERDAAERLENVGRASVPFVGTMLGGTGAEAGQAVMRGGMNALRYILPALTFQPEFAYAGAGYVAGGAMSAISAPAKISLEQVAMTGAASATISKMTSDESYESQHEFIHGIKVSGTRPADAGIAKKISDELPQVDKIIAEGGRKGNLRFTDDGKGMISIEVVDGPKAGLFGLYDRNSRKLVLEGGETRSYEYDVPQH